MRRDDVRAPEVPGHAVTVRDAVLGRYTLAAQRQDEPFDSTKLGLAVSAKALERRRVVGLPGTPADVLNGRLTRGDRVDLLLSPKEAGTEGGTRLRGLLVLDVQGRSEDARQYVIVLRCVAGAVPDWRTFGSRPR